jgi:hypothetical protein
MQDSVRLDTSVRAERRANQWLYILKSRAESVQMIKLTISKGSRTRIPNLRSNRSQQSGLTSNQE